MEGKLPGRADNGHTVAEMGLADSEGFPFKGTIDFVNNQLDRDTATLEARAKFENDDQFLTPGLFAKVRIPGSPKYTATLIPDETVGSDQRSKFVWLVNAEGLAEKRPVTLGPLHEGLRIVRSGVAPEDRVVVSGLQRLRPGAPVDAKEAEGVEAPTDNAAQ
jgi:RND family efflux transporter MFP subunit